MNDSTFFAFMLLKKGCVFCSEFFIKIDEIESTNNNWNDI